MPKNPGLSQGLPSSLPPDIRLGNGRTDWEQTYATWFETMKGDWRRLKSHLKKSKEPEPWECERTWLQHESVMYAIEAVWGALYLGSDTKFMLSDELMNQFLRGPFDRADANVRPAGKLAAKMIMPLCGTHTNKRFDIPDIDGSNNRARMDLHHVCVVASRIRPERRPKKNELTAVEMEIFDSSPSKLYHPAVFRHALNIAQNSGWLATDDGGLPVQHRIDVRRRDSPTVPRQGANARCGLYAILNAWAVLLGIPIIGAELRRTPGSRNRCGTATDLERDALEIANAAVAGLVRLPLIQAFFFRYGYAEAGQELNGITVPDIVTSFVDADHEVRDIIQSDTFRTV